MHFLFSLYLEWRRGAERKIWPYKNDTIKYQESSNAISSKNYPPNINFDVCGQHYVPQNNFKFSSKYFKWCLKFKFLISILDNNLWSIISADWVEFCSIYKPLCLSKLNWCFSLDLIRWRWSRVWSYGPIRCQDVTSVSVSSAQSWVGRRRANMWDNKIHLIQVIKLLMLINTLM